MPNDRNRGNDTFSRFDAMTTEALEEILRLDAEKTEGEESDTQTLLYVMEVLAVRKRNSENPGKTAEKAFESFKQYYMPTDDVNDASQDYAERKMNKSHRWIRTLTAIAASIAIVFLCSMTANAFGYDIWETVAKWTQETFHFGSGVQTEVSEPNKDDEQECTSLQDILSLYDISALLAPTWFPDGYQLVDSEVKDSPVQLLIATLYQKEGLEIKVQIKKYLNTDPQQVERSDGLVETYESEGITYYIFANNNLLQAVWVNENYECYISGDLTVEELKNMIDSIGKG